MWNSYRTGAPQKIRTPRKMPEKWTFLSLAFYNAPSLHIVNKVFVDDKTAAITGKIQHSSLR